jgi:hypothetical protein
MGKPQMSGQGVRAISGFRFSYSSFVMGKSHGAVVPGDPEKNFDVFARIRSTCRSYRLPCIGEVGRVDVVKSPGGSPDQTKMQSEDGVDLA